MRTTIGWIIFYGVDGFRVFRRVIVCPSDVTRLFLISQVKVFSLAVERSCRAEAIDCHPKDNLPERVNSAWIGMLLIANEGNHT